MRILHININYLGTALYRTMRDNLKQLGIENSVFVPEYDGAGHVIQPDETITVSKCFKKIDRWFFNYKSNKIFRTLEKNYEIKNYDIIHAYMLFSDGNVALQAKKKYGVPYVVWIQNTDVNSFFKYMIHLRKRGLEIMKNASAIVFLSEAYKNAVFTMYVPVGLKDELLKKTFVIPIGIDDFWFENLYIRKPERTTDDPIRLIYVGRILADKNVEGVQKGREILRIKGIKTDFTVVGPITDQEYFDTIMKDGTIRYVSTQPKEKLIEYYRNADIFVMPSFHESFGLVYAEAMSQGLPIIYTKGQGFDKQFEDGEVGYPVEAKNSDQIAESINKIIEQYSLLSKNCIIDAKKFSWKKIAKQYSELYNNIC